MSTEKNIQIKFNNGVDWDSLFPKTKATITMLNDGTTVESKISDMVSTLANKVTIGEVNTEINKIIGSAPESLDTLQELSDALNNDSNFATTVTNQLSNKVDKITGKTLTTNDFTNELKNKLNSLQGITVDTIEPLNGIWFEEI